MRDGCTTPAICGCMVAPIPVDCSIEDGDEVSRANNGPDGVVAPPLCGACDVGGANRVGDKMTVGPITEIGGVGVSIDTVGIMSVGAGTGVGTDRKAGGPEAGNCFGLPVGTLVSSDASSEEGIGAGE